MNKFIKKFITKLTKNGFKNFTFKFKVIHKIYKFLVLTKNHMNILKDNIFEFFFKNYNRFYSFIF